MMKINKQLMLLIALVFSPLAVFAADGAIDKGDTAWILTATALVLFMTLPGLSLFYAGLVRSKNVLSILMQCFAIACVSSILWFSFVYSLAFTQGNGFIGDFSKAFLANVTMDSVNATIPEPLFALFQMTFAVITPALIIGAFAERMKFSSVLIFSALWLIVVYGPVCHWIWGGGWLAKMGMIDFAGGTVVHITAGIAALVTALMIKNRNGFPTTAMPPHNMTMTITGAGMLWVGWFGFNGGSALAAGGAAAMAMLVTHLSAASGAIAWMVIEWKKFGKPSVLGIVTGMVAGLGTITPAAGSVGPAAGIVIGLSAGIICFYATHLIKRKFVIDDSLDVFPVHGVGGILGSLLVALFASQNLGVFSGFAAADYNMLKQFGVQALGVVVTIGYTALATYVLVKITGWLTNGIRVTAEQEQEGLDLAMHEETGYKY